MPQPYNPWATPILPGSDTASPYESYSSPPVASVLSQIAGALGKAFMAPGQALQSTTPITSDQMIKPAADIGMMTTLGAGAIPAEANTLRAGLGLPMDEASRLARATEQGYKIDAYKGGQPYDWNTMPSKDWKGNVIPGTEHLVPQELTTINSPNAKYAGFFSSDPEVANRFAEPFEHGAVWPTKIKFDNPLVIDAKGKHAASFQFDTIAKRDGTLDEMSAFKRAFEDGSPHDGVILKNTKDEGDVYIPRHPDQIRSRFAAFNPANAGSGLLLGGLAGLAAPIFSEPKQ